MSQGSTVIANGSGAAVRAAINAGLAALLTNNSGASAPATPSAGMFWADTAANLLKQRNAANTAWNTLFSLTADLVQPSTFKNKIINGAMLVDQEFAGASTTFTAGLTGQPKYAIDQWYAFCSGANVTGQQIANPLLANTYRYRLTGAASNTGVGVGQRIEAINTAMLAGGSATLQAKLSSSSLTAITWTAYYATTKDTFGTLGTPTRTQIAAGTFTISATEATYSSSFAIPAAGTTGLEIVFTGAALLAGQHLQIGDVQLEAGANKTIFEDIPYGIELARCQRYYEKSYATNETPGSAVAATPWISSAQATCNYMRISGGFKVNKRATPTMTMYSQTGVAGQVTVDGTGTNAVINGTETGFSFYLNNIAMILNQFMYGHWSASARL